MSSFLSASTFDMLQFSFQWGLTIVEIPQSSSPLRLRREPDEFFKN